MTTNSIPSPPYIVEPFSSSAPPPVYILGAGSIGLLLASAIRSTFPSYPVRLLLRETSALWIGGSEERRGEVTISIQQLFTNQSSSRDGTTLTHHSLPPPPKASRRTHPRLVPIPFEVIPSLNHHRKAFSPSSYVLLTTKAHQAKAAVQSIQQWLDPTTTVVIMCNGALAVEEELRELQFPSSNISTAFTTHGAYREGTSKEEDSLPHLVHAGDGEIVLQNCTSLARLLDDCGMHARSVVESTVVGEDMQFLLWQKLAANAVVNPLTALYQCHNGALYDTVPHFATHYLPGIVREVAAVYRAVTAHHASTLATDDRLFLDYVIQVIEKTAQNRSSSYQDVLQGRRPLEIPYLTGYILRQAAVHQIACPIQTELYAQLQFPGAPGDITTSPEDGSG